MLRAVAPTQLAAAVMLAAGGVVALSGQPSIGLLVLCIAGALGTVAAGAWQGARYMHAAAGARLEALPTFQRTALCGLHPVVPVTNSVAVQAVRASSCG